MINKISEVPLRTLMKIDPIGPIHDQEAARLKADTARQDRPVEHSSAGSQADAKSAEEKGDSKYLFEGRQLVYEKYNQTGEVIYRVPPSSTPIDERV